MLLFHVRHKILVWNDGVGLKKHANGIVDGGPAGNNLWVICVKLAVYLVNIATNRRCEHTQILQIIPQRQSGGNEVNGGKPHDDFVHEWSVLNAIKGVVIAVGK